MDRDQDREQPQADEPSGAPPPAEEKRRIPDEQGLDSVESEIGADLNVDPLAPPQGDQE
jgi:hypothetical protein